MKTAYSQKGMTPLGGLFVAATVGSIILLILKLLPHYMDYDAVKKAHEKLAKDTSLMSYPLTGVQNKITMLLITSNVRSYNRENTYIDDSTDKPVLGFSYKIKEHITGNVYALLEFENEVEIKVED